VSGRDPQVLGTTGNGTVRIDFSDRGSIAVGLEGIKRLFLNSGQHPEMASMQGNVVSAARAANVEHIVKVSGGSAVTGADKPSWAGRAHAFVEQEIIDSGIAYTFLRPNYFMQNLLNLAAPIKSGKLPFPLADQRMAIVDARDIGAVAATVLADPSGHAGAVYEITGPEALSLADVAARLSRVAGHDVQHITTPLEATRETMKAAGAPDWLQQHFGEVITIFGSDPTVADVSDAVQRLTGRAPRTVEQFLGDHVDAFAGRPVA
jgi:uncharacterized protein YbjT (DUF2867 family)